MSSSRLGTKCGGPLRRAALVIGLQHGKNKNMISLLSVVFCVFTLHAFFLHVICLMRAFLFFVFLQSFFFYHDVRVSSAFFSSFVILVIPMFRVFFFLFPTFFFGFPNILLFCRTPHRGVECRRAPPEWEGSPTAAHRRAFVEGNSRQRLF